MCPSTLSRLGLAFRIGWWLRGIAAVPLFGMCATPVKRCEFPLWVTVTPNADAECRALAPMGWKADDGRFITDMDTVNGCAPKDRIITNGDEYVGGHELRHAVERNCQ